MDALEDLFARNGHNPSIYSVAHHGVRLSGSRLPVREEATMVALPGIVEDLLPHGVVDMLLVGIAGTGGNTEAFFVDLELVMRPERVIKTEISVLRGVTDVFDHYILYPIELFYCPPFPHRGDSSSTSPASWMVSLSLPPLQTL